MSNKLTIWSSVTSIWHYCARHALITVEYTSASTVWCWNMFYIYIYIIYVFPCKLSLILFVYPFSVMFKVLFVYPFSVMFKVLFVYPFSASTVWCWNMFYIYIYIIYVFPFRRVKSEKTESLFDIRGVST
jgi:hypothetical protein